MEGGLIDKARRTTALAKLKLPTLYPRRKHISPFLRQIFGFVFIRLEDGWRGGYEGACGAGDKA
jgi:hypothetical protein